MIQWLRQCWDRIWLTDHEWKKKYCPELYHWLFEMSPEEREACVHKARLRSELIWSFAGEMQRRKTGQFEGSILLSNVEYSEAEKELKRLRAID